jgi:hypothetical protein
METIAYRTFDPIFKEAKEGPCLSKTLTALEIEHEEDSDAKSKANPKLGYAALLSPSNARCLKVHVKPLSKKALLALARSTATTDGSNNGNSREAGRNKKLQPLFRSNPFPNGRVRAGDEYDPVERARLRARLRVAAVAREQEKREKRVPQRQYAAFGVRGHVAKLNVEACPAPTHALLVKLAGKTFSSPEPLSDDRTEIEPVVVPRA